MLEINERLKYKQWQKIKPISISSVLSYEVKTGRSSIFKLLKEQHENIATKSEALSSSN